MNGAIVALDIGMGLMVRKAMMRWQVKGILMTSEQGYMTVDWEGG